MQQQDTAVGGSWRDGVVQGAHSAGWAALNKAGELSATCMRRKIVASSEGWWGANLCGIGAAGGWVPGARPLSSAKGRGAEQEITECACALRLQKR